METGGNPDHFNNKGTSSAAISPVNTTAAKSNILIIAERSK